MRFHLIKPLFNVRTGVSKCSVAKAFLYLQIVSFMIRPVLSAMGIHYKCRSPIYPRSNVERFPVPDEKVPWSSEFKEYKPSNYTSPTIEGKPWADREIGRGDKFNLTRIGTMTMFEIICKKAQAPRACKPSQSKYFMLIILEKNYR